MNKEQIKKQDNIVIGISIFILLAIVMFLFMFNSENTTASKEIVVQKSSLDTVKAVQKAHGYAITSFAIKLINVDSIQKSQDSVHKSDHAELLKLRAHYKKYHQE